MAVSEIKAIFAEEALCDELARRTLSTSSKIVLALTGIGIFYLLYNSYRYFQASKQLKEKIKQTIPNIDAKRIEQLIPRILSLKEDVVSSEQRYLKKLEKEELQRRLDEDWAFIQAEISSEEAYNRALAELRKIDPDASEESLTQLTLSARARIVARIGASLKAAPRRPAQPPQEAAFVRSQEQASMPEVAVSAQPAGQGPANEPQQEAAPVENPAPAGPQDQSGGLQAPPDSLPEQSVVVAEKPSPAPVEKKLQTFEGKEALPQFHATIIAAAYDIELGDQIARKMLPSNITFFERETIEKDVYRFTIELSKEQTTTIPQQIEKGGYERAAGVRLSCAKRVSGTINITKDGFIEFDDFQLTIPATWTSPCMRLRKIQIIQNPEHHLGAKNEHQILMEVDSSWFGKQLGRQQKIWSQSELEATIAGITWPS